MNSDLPPKYVVSLTLVGLLLGYLAGSFEFPPSGENPANTRSIGHNVIARSAPRTAITTVESGSASAVYDDTIRHLREAVSGRVDAGIAGDDNGNIDDVNSAIDAARNPAISAATTVPKEKTEIRRLTIVKSPVDATIKDNSVSAKAVAPPESPPSITRKQSITPVHYTTDFTIYAQVGMADPETDVRLFEAEPPCEDSFALVTTPRLGFSNEEKTYLLGQPIFELIGSYGLAAEKISDTFTGINARLYTAEEYQRTYAADTTTYVYLRRGLLVTSDNHGLIKGAFFYISNGLAGTPADICTRFGDAGGASLEAIINAYGQPAATRHHDPLGYYDLSVDYEFGGGTLTFSFWRNKLISLGIAHNAS